jgi:hypothetical protein
MEMAMPNAAERSVLAQRASRNTAKARLDGRIGRMRADLEERGIGGRIADEASARAMAALDEAAEVASQSKGIIGGTLALLLIWFMRRPIIDALGSLMGERDTKERQERDDDK